MRTRLVGLLAGALVGTAAIVAPGAEAAVSVAITSPAAGASISRSANETIEVLGTASFGAPLDTSTKWFVRRDDCGGAADNPHLSVLAGTDQGDGCGNLLGVLGNEDSYSAVDGFPATLRAGKVAGQVTMSSFQGITGSPVGASAGQASLTITISGSDDEGEGGTLLNVTKTYLVTPNQPVYTIPFEGDLPSSLAGLRLTSLSLTVSMAEGMVLHGFVGASGTSFFSLPTVDRGRVEVSTSSSFTASTTVTAEQDGVGGWAAEVTTPAVGARKIFARATQGTDRATVNIPITVTS